MMFPFMSPQACPCPVVQPHSAETAAAGPSETAGQLEPCQATQKTQQASQGQALMDIHHKCSACAHVPVMALAPTMHALCPLGANPLPMNQAASPSRPSQEMSPTTLCTAIPLFRQPVVPGYQTAMQTPASDHVVPVNTHQEGC